MRRPSTVGVRNWNRMLLHHQPVQRCHSDQHQVTRRGHHSGCRHGPYRHSTVVVVHWWFAPNNLLSIWFVVCFSAVCWLLGFVCLFYFWQHHTYSRILARRVTNFTDRCSIACYLKTAIAYATGLDMDSEAISEISVVLGPIMIVVNDFTVCFRHGDDETSARCWRAAVRVGQSIVLHIKMVCCWASVWLGIIEFKRELKDMTSAARYEPIGDCGSLNDHVTHIYTENDVLFRSQNILWPP